MFIFLINICACTLFGFIEYGKLLEIEFIIVLSLLMTLIFVISAIFPSKTKTITKKNVIILRPPQWYYTYKALEEHLPDCLIIEVMKYQFVDNPTFLDFNLYKS